MKERIDVILVNKGLATSREKAKTMLKAGNVLVNGQKEEKASTTYEVDQIMLEIIGDTIQYVSRGGLKLEKAMNTWNLSLENRICMDIGASTGGFTDCMLQNGAAKVYSVDVGSNQLAEKLRQDPRVVCMEQTNFRYVTCEDIPYKLDFISVDVSFISLTKILIPARKLLKEGGQMVCLIKPQFEAGKNKVGKNGVVREPSVHRRVINKIIDFADVIGFSVLHLDYSPVRGPEGNIEYLLHLVLRTLPEQEKGELTEQDAEEKLEEVIQKKSGLSANPSWVDTVNRVVRVSHG